MPARYTPLHNPGSVQDAERELDDAFESDSDDEGVQDHESTPLTHQNHTASVGYAHADTTTAIPGAYDFERDYDYPPPGSPPRPSALALPNDYGNSNGQMPSTPVRTTIPRPSFFRRAVGTILPTHYTHLSSDSRVSRTRGGGIENDGVFANVMAKPQRPRTVRNANGEVHVVPEESQKEAPPSYSDAQADAVPPYWETTVHAPSGLDASGDMIIDDLPSGSIWIFVANICTSFFFQFIGFLLTHLLHTTHAAKHGSRAGLGLTLIQYGFYSRSAQSGDISQTPPSWPVPTEEETADTTPDLASSEPGVAGISPRDWISFLLMTIGWFLLLSSIINFWRIKRWEASIRASANPEPISAEDIERDIALRRNLENVFGFGFEEDERETRSRPSRRGGGSEPPAIPDREHLQEQRLARDLRAAGLL